jgi:hypothetical protein
MVEITDRIVALLGLETLKENNSPHKSRLRIDRRKRWASIPEKKKVTFSRKY